MTLENSENGLEQLAAKLNAILLDFRLNLTSLHEKIEALDSNSFLNSNAEALTDGAKLKAFNLELEVKQLREDLKIIKELLGFSADSLNQR